MLLKSQTIIKQEELVSILEAQLKKAKTRLSELSKADTKIKSVVAELESLLTEHPDYKLLVSDRLKLGESEAEQTGPVRIEIESVGKTAEYTESEIEAYDSLFGDGPPQTAPQTEEIITEKSAWDLENPPLPIESPYSSEAEIAQLIEAHDQLSQRNQPTEQEISAWASGHEQVQSQQPAEVAELQQPKTDFSQNLTPTELKQQLLSKVTRAELDAFKANIGSANLKEIWGLCSIPERNQIKCLSKATVTTKRPATLGYKFQYKGKHEAIYLGYYLHGEAVKEEDERVIFVKGEAIICKKTDIRPAKNQPGLTPEDRVRLEAIISEPLSEMDFEVFVGKFKKLYLEERRRQELEGVVAIRSKEICQKFAQNHNISESLLQEYFDKLKSDGLIFAVQENNKELFQWIYEQPTANDIASNTFTGLQPAPKQNGSESGKQQNFSQSEQSDVVQTELYLKVEQPAPSKKTEVIPTPLLETVAGEIKKVNPELTFGYDSNGKSTFLDVYHGTSYIGIFEDDGVDLYSSNTAKMLHHGFTEEMITALTVVELSPKA